MATLHLQDVPEDLYVRLEQLAKSQHRTISAQVISLLESTLPPQTPQSQSETPKSVTEILAEINRRREQLPTDVEWPDSTALIREDRDR
ncbi:hypothetical protein [Argonema antarcticum]|uniref:hypothetical protein n=1 Tax=Argonema antarcticum TaxID=2942763 RepID=UPI002013023B|nr:hypothetical protein [Argonema antarcticum]MCL1469658.1 hypothetical protein [Argonema antarcticum A004/B2]